ncbi:unnamed protein product [Didymodactylos carnosus]|uniref:Uncharacterized protein n=1 Tax=Didymodactylos carnosus TaxID=1234261 RepID=A0A815DR60_9BILA|nr:unnamed protein product [Didymodactylos carnosus]CAF4122902.1 unnamed protein product [Didymodactylos carnosus]
MATNRKMSKFVHQSRKECDQNGQKIDVADHHIISKAQIREGMNKYMEEIPDNNVLKQKIEGYLNDDRNNAVKTLIINELPWADKDQAEVQDRHCKLLIQGFIWNPNNLVPGPTKDRGLDPKSKIDKELLKDLPPEYTTLASRPSNMLDKLTQLRSKDIEKATWEKRANGKFYFKPNSSDPSNVYDFPSYDQSSKS